MDNKWIIYEHHIAIERESEILHPDASEVYDFIVGDADKYDIVSPLADLEQLHFSKVGSPIKCEVYTTDQGIVKLELYAIRKNRKWLVDMIDGKIIDHCIGDNEWFYINGDIDSLQQLLSNADIKQIGIINIGQYIDLLKQEYFSEHKEIIDSVSNDSLMIQLIPDGKVPTEIQAKLYEYQRVGFLWMNQMLEACHGCIIGDEMGLGKTLQVITVFQELKNRKELPLLVIAPVTLLENWKRECEKFAPEINTYVHHGPYRTGRYNELVNHDVVIISYNTAVSDLSMLKMIDWKCVVLDEAQNIKNPNSDRAKSVKAIGRKRSIAVTGTPFENHITDIWSLVDFSVPGLLGTLDSFKRNVTDDVLGAKRIEPILSPIMIRRLVKDVALDLPEKVIITQPIEMSESEKIGYERYRQEAKKSADGGAAISLAILQKLRMYCTHPTLCDDSDYSDPVIESIKYERFCEIVEEIINLNEKVIVFTSYKKMFELFLRDIPRRFGIKVDFINGATPVDNRQKIVDWFNCYDGPAMLALNPRAAGTGLNITGANHVIHFNLEWNPSLEDQSSARAYRRGQDKTVFIYRLYYVNTVEQIVNERIERKREIASNAIIGNVGDVSDGNDMLRALEMAPELQKKG